jgi:hypothetical protein
MENARAVRMKYKEKVHLWVLEPGRSEGFILCHNVTENMIKRFNHRISRNKREVNCEECQQMIDHEFNHIRGHLFKSALFGAITPEEALRICYEAWIQEVMEE